MELKRTVTDEKLTGEVQEQIEYAEEPVSLEDWPNEIIQAEGQKENEE